MGTNNRPFFRVTVADSRSPAKGRFIENIGWYDPVKAGDDNANINFERLEYWLNHGAETTVAAKALIKRTRKVAASASTVTAAPPEPAPVAPAATEAPADA